MRSRGKKNNRCCNCYNQHLVWIRIFLVSVAIILFPQTAHANEMGGSDLGSMFNDLLFIAAIGLLIATIAILVVIFSKKKKSRSSMEAKGESDEVSLHPTEHTSHKPNNTGLNIAFGCVFVLILPVAGFLILFLAPMGSGHVSGIAFILGLVVLAIPIGLWKLAKVIITRKYANSNTGKPDKPS